MRNTADPSEPLDEFSELEALVRGARDYVRPSDDLRPKVLEAARRQREVTRLQGYLRLAAVVVLVAGLSLAALRQHFERAEIRRPGVLATMARDWLITPAAGAGRQVDESWNMVESFTELRRRQALLLRPTQELPRPEA